MKDGATTNIGSYRSFQKVAIDFSRPQIPTELFTTLNCYFSFSLSFPSPPSTAMTTAAAAAAILHHTTLFLSDIVSNHELRHHLITSLQASSSDHDETTVKLAADTLEAAISFSTTPPARASSLSLAEKLLTPLPQHPLSSFLLSLTLTLCNRHSDAAVHLLRIFRSSPSLSRSEIAPILFDRLFSFHLVPVFRRFHDRRAQILSMNSTSHSQSNCDMISLTKVSEDQASRLRELESEYEDVLDANCRVFAEYFEEVLVSEDGETSISPPLLVMRSSGKGDGTENDEEEEKEEIETPELQNERYNPIWTEKETSIDFSGISSSISSLSYAPFYPQRVSPKVFKLQKSPENLTSPVYLNSAVEPISSLEENLLCSSSESEAESEVIETAKTKTNPMRSENKYLYIPFYPVSTKIFEPQKSSEELSVSILDSATEPESALNDNLPCSSSESEAKCEEKDENMALLEPQQGLIQEPMQTNFTELIRSSDKHYPMADYDSTPHASYKQVPPNSPNDFVCPIISNLFDDPVTLETGQSYERRAREKWYNITKTNYVLKQLIASWKEQNPDSGEIPYEDTESVEQSVTSSTSPGNDISQAIVDEMSELSHAVNNLYMSEVLEESEMAVLQIEKLWRGTVNLRADIQRMLTIPPIINGFMVILFYSVDPVVLQAAVFLLAELGSRDDTVIETLTRVDKDVECIMSLFKKGLIEAVVLIYLLKPSTTSLIEMAIVENLITIFDREEEELLEMCLKPRTAAVLLLALIIRSSEERIASSVANAVLFSEKAFETIVGSLGAESAKERIAAVEILLKCMQEDGTCRNFIADKAELSTILESFIGATDKQRFEIIQFFSELVKLIRRTFNEQILHIIKDEGSFSTMHTLLIYLQRAPQDQCPIVAGFLLQLDLLVEPKKKSIYREEAIDSLVSCLRNTDFPPVQLAAAETIVSLQGRFTLAGKPFTREVLLERAGLDSSCSLLQIDQISNFCEGIKESIKEETAADDWERKIAYVLVSHDSGILFEALADGLMKSQNAELSAACFISATWLIYMLTILPDTGIQGVARFLFLKRLVSILKSSKDTEDRILSMLALKTFLDFDDGLSDLTSYAKDMLKALGDLKRFSPMASEMMKLLVKENDPKVVKDIWTHKELIQLDCKENGQVLSVIFFKEKLFSGHSDGTIKVWKVQDSLIHLLQETKEHTKDVTSLAISESGDRLFSGSLDRTAKVWSIRKTGIHHMQVHDTKDQIYNLVVTNSMSCFIPQGIGIKVQPWKGESKLLNSIKHVKCLTVANGRLYCGCNNNSVQEIDLDKGTVNTIQTGSKKFLGKSNPIRALQIDGEFIYAASSSLDGSVIKIWNSSDYSVVGSLQSALEVRAMVVSSELIYLGCKGGAVEIWDKKKHNRVDILMLGTNCRVLCMAQDSNEEILVVGTPDGQIQAWGIK
ncbi:hypothetical protein RIF29_06652 [Crotalaria pallida]|uniref:RING-type E3 ubiquitin transferase n=1 Tax=Crotalaria pallida TaxID=3830 RepID=A0AAN9J4Z4_CROPI